MKITTTDLWTYPADMRFVTTNSYVNSRGELVMGRGAALQAKQRYSDVPKLAGKYIFHLSKYGLCHIPQYQLGLFQVKYHFKDRADLDLIRYSFGLLEMYAAQTCGTIAMNFPGIGYGGLDRNDVLDVMREYELPNVVICEYEHV